MRSLFAIAESPFATRITPDTGQRLLHAKNNEAPGSNPKESGRARARSTKQMARNVALRGGGGTLMACCTTFRQRACPSQPPSAMHFR